MSDTAPRTGDRSRRARGLTARIYLSPESAARARRLARRLKAPIDQAVDRALKAALVMLAAEEEEQ